jgi:hypothetical protein
VASEWLLLQDPRHQSTSNPKSISRLVKRSRIADAKLSIALAALFISFGCRTSAWSAHQGVKFPHNRQTTEHLAGLCDAA